MIDETEDETVCDAMHESISGHYLARIRDAVSATQRIGGSSGDAEQYKHLGELVETAGMAYKTMLSHIGLAEANPMFSPADEIEVADVAISNLEIAVEKIFEAQLVQEIMES
jgi:hypothetical protein